MIGDLGHAVRHGQDIPIHSGTLRPAGGFGNVKALQRGQIKLAGLAHGDLAIVAGAAQYGQRGVLAQVKAGELVEGTVQLGQRSVLTQVKAGELVVLAIQLGQRGVLAQIKAGELVGLAVQLGQLSVFAHIQTGEIVVFTVQLIQIREKFNAGQVFDISMIDVELGHAIQLILTEGAVVVLVATELHIGDEIIIWEVGRVNGDAARFIPLRGAGFCSGQGRSPFRQHRCAQRQGECTCHSGSADALNSSFEPERENIPPPRNYPDLIIAQKRGKGNEICVNRLKICVKSSRRRIFPLDGAGGR